MGIGHFAGGKLHQALGGVALTLRVNLVAQPAQQWRIAPARQLFIQMRVIQMGFSHELCGIHIAEGVCRKVAESPHAPVDVLETTLRIIRHLQSESFLELLIPYPGQVPGFNFSFDQAVFDLEPQDDVQVVGEFIRLDADEARFGPIHKPRTVLGGMALEPGKIMNRFFVPERPKLQRASDMILPEPGLGLMDAQGAERA